MLASVRDGGMAGELTQKSTSSICLKNLSVDGRTLSEKRDSREVSGQCEPILLKYEKHFPKMYGDVGMAVPKTTQTRYMDGSVQATQMTTQVTPSLHHFSFLSSTQSSFQYSDNKA